MQPASKGKRAFNFMADGIIVYVIFFIYSNIAYNLTEVNVLSKVWLWWYWFLYFTYYLFFESIFQKTPAKMLSKTYVVTIHGDVPGFWRILIRSIVRFSPFDFISYMFGLGKGQHDYFSKTEVVENS